MAVAPGPYDDQLGSKESVQPLVFGPQSASSYRRDEGPADSTLGVGDDPARLDMLSTAGLDLIVRGFAHTVRAAAGLMAVSDKAGELVRVLSAWGEAMTLDDLPASLTGGFVGRAFGFERAALEPLWSEDSLSSAAAGEMGLRYAAGVGIRSATGLTGSLCAAFPGPPNGDHTTVLQAVESHGRLASLCLDEPDLLQGLLASAQLDGLTHCLNYTAIRHELDREIRRAERHRLSLSCCFLDLDDFKMVNERHGHLYGSHLLAEVAAAIGAAIRSEDTLGRYGGDEFVAIFPETGEAAAVRLAERVRSAISEGVTDTLDGRVEASIGVAEWSRGVSAEDLLHAADQALSAVKERGGAGVISAGRIRTYAAEGR
jgi:diguanylate cyclase (GGDEF)-like protein